MNLDLTLVLLMLAAAIVMFVINRPRMDAVALLVMVAMPFTGIITMNEALAGFADPSIILIAALFVIGEGLVMTGVARRLGDWLDAKAGGSENRLLILLMAAVGGLGSLMSSTAVVAIFIPVVLRISQNRGTAPSRLMMPLSFAALISGMLTLVATAPNLVVNAELIRQGAQGFNFFSFTPFGLPLLVTRHRLYAFRARPAGLQDRPAGCGGPPPEPSAVDRAVQPRRSRKTRPHKHRLVARRKAPRRIAAAVCGREPSRHRARDGVCGQGAPSNRADGTAGGRCTARRCAHLERTASTSCGIP